MEKVTKRFENIMIISFIMCLLDIIAGIVFIKFIDYGHFEHIVLGSLFILHSLFYLIRYIYDGLGNKFFAVNLITSVASLILGIFTIINPLSEIISPYGILFGTWLLIYGIEKIYYSIRFMTSHESSSPLVLFIGIIMIIMGILSMINPFSSFMLTTKLIGIFLICSGLLEAMICNLFKQRGKNILSIFIHKEAIEKSSEN